MEAAEGTPSGVDLVVLTGLSGSGKSTALRALEDVGFFCIDNLPAPLLGTFLDLADDHARVTRAAVAMDIREAGLSPDLARELKELQDAGQPLHVLYLSCSDDRAIARFSETRRRHPLIAAGEARTLAEAIHKEREWLSALRHLATTVIDTTDLTVHDLKRRVQEAFGDPESRSMSLQLVSFGFRYGLPPEADFVFDVRYVPNPYFVPELRPMSGLDAPVQEYVLAQEPAQKVLGHIESLLSDVLPWCEREGKAQVTVAVGCTGGRHRSVTLIEQLRRRLGELGRHPTVSHRDVDR